MVERPIKMSANKVVTILAACISTSQLNVFNVPPRRNNNITRNPKRPIANRELTTPQSKAHNNCYIESLQSIKVSLTCV